MSEERRIEEYVERRPATNDFGRGTNDEYSGREVCVRRSKLLPTDQQTIVVEDTVEVVALFNDQMGILAVGGYVRAESKLEVTCKIECRSSGNTFENDRSMTTIPGIWSGIGAHVRVPVSNHSAVSVDVSVQFDSTETEDIEIFGLNVDCVDDGDRLRDNYRRDDGTSIQQYFERLLEESQASTSFVPVLYYLDHTRPFHVDVESTDTSTWENGGIVFMKACNRPPGRYLPTEFRLDLEGKNVNYSSKQSTKKLQLILDDSTVPATEIPDKLIDRLDTERNLKEVQADSEADPVHVVTQLGKQYECRACKNLDANFRGNLYRTTSQLREDSAASVYDELGWELLGKTNPYKVWRAEHDEEFYKAIKRKFDHECFRFNCDNTENDSMMEIDHTLPKSYLYPLDESATLLCKEHNNGKRNDFPKKYYEPEELDALASKTGLGDKIRTTKINTAVVDELLDNIQWFFDDFLPDQFEDRSKAAVFCSRLQDKLDSEYSTYDSDLVATYERETDTAPSVLN